MQTYPLTPSQLATVSATELIAFIKSPTLVARRLGEILQAQQFLGNFLLQGRFTITGGAIAVPINEVIRTVRGAEVVAPGAEYKLTPMSQEEYEFYSAVKEGLGTEVTDEQIGRLLRQPIDDAFTFLQTDWCSRRTTSRWASSRRRSRTRSPHPAPGPRASRSTRTRCA